MRPVADYPNSTSANQFLELLFDRSTSERLDTTPSKLLLREPHQASEHLGLRIADELKQVGRLPNSGPPTDVMNPCAPTGGLTSAG